VEALLLPESIGGLALVSVGALGSFAVLFGIAWLASRANARQLLLKWHGSWQPILWGFVASIALRIGVAVIIAVPLMFWFAIHKADPKEFDKYRSAGEHVVNAAVLVNDPLYFALTLTVISFVVAGLREELWRAGMLAGMKAIFPQKLQNRRGEFLAICIVAVLFGLGHTIQGWTGVLLTTLLGVGLGTIMIWRRSIWEAVIAHGFFDASTFALLYFFAKYHPDALHSL
jgi:membrane protease YdiL (CAAX protease family)